MARLRMWSVHVPASDRLSFFSASKTAAFMTVRNTSRVMLKPKSLIAVCIKHAGCSSRQHCLQRNSSKEGSQKLNSVLRKVFPTIPTSATQMNNITFCTRKHTCKCMKSKNRYINQRLAHRDFSVSSSVWKDVKQSTDSGLHSDTDDEHIRAALDSITPSVPMPSFVDIVPGKGPPPEPPVDCCMSGCANCVWIQYAEELKQYYSLDEGNERAKKAIEQIDNPGLQMFLKFELGLL